MPAERENKTVLTQRHYDIDGNDLRAYYNDAGHLVFVIDVTTGDVKPNVLLVMNPVGNRKWDDVLENDWNVDLETVRPRRDNKYQKLDIEYGGLNIYDNLIRAYDSGDDISGALAELVAFRNASVRRAATERLDAANRTIERANETIEKTNDSVAELQSRVRTLNAKLTQHRKSVGRKPTKESASKILKTEAQLDATNDKIRRAKRRIVNAKRRMAAAADDATAAQELLARIPEIVDVPAAPRKNDLSVVVAKSNINEPKATEMADEEVKPLFDKDPEILDEEIAFKPIDFDAPSPFVAGPVDQAPTDDTAPVVEPLTFVPPVSPHAVDAASDEVAPQPQTVVNVFAPVPDVPAADLAPAPQADAPTPILNTITPATAPVADDAPVVATPAPDVAPAPAPTPESRPAPIAPNIPSATDVRPVSPITGNVTPVSPGTTQKPSVIYYVALGVLIMLSIFTLWLYQQRSTTSTVPNLTAVVSSENVVETPAAPTATDVATTPFVDENTAPSAPVDAPRPVVVEAEPEPVVVEPEPTVVEPVTEPEPEPVVVEPEPEPVVAASAPVATEPAPAPVPAVTVNAISTVAPTPTPTVTETPKIVESEEEILAKKPSYSVSSSQQEMFVASPSYDTETVVETEEAVTCDDGSAPDMRGCCPGEVFSDMGDGTTACCIDGTDTCFPPLEI